jgi:hypothetical protein
MKKWLIGILIALVAIAVGVGGAYAYAKAYPVQSTAKPATRWGGQWSWQFQPGSPNGQSNGGGQGFMFPADPQNGNDWGMMGPRGGQGSPSQSQQDQSTRLSVDEVVSQVKEYLKGQSANLKVAEVMEFSNNDYVAITESDTGRGAMELLVDPYSGAVSPEIGPNMIWNLKYGSMPMMRTGSATDNTLTLDEAKTKATDALSVRVAGATLNEDGRSFYGYYTFDYSVDGKVSGMLSVNGLTGRVMFHTWHGTFIDEKEF